MAAPQMTVRLAEDAGLDIGDVEIGGPLGRKADSASVSVALSTEDMARLPSALGGTTSANSFPVVLSSDGPFALQAGSLTEAAPATDTASSGLNGRLQRAAQRLTSLIALITQGVQALAASQAVNNTSATLYPGTLATSTSAAALASSQAVREVLLQNDPDNTVDILVGNTTAQTIQLKPGWSVTIPVSNLATVFAKSVSGTPTLNYLGRS